MINSGNIIPGKILGMSNEIPINVCGNDLSEICSAYAYLPVDSACKPAELCQNHTLNKVMGTGPWGHFDCLYLNQKIDYLKVSCAALLVLMIIFLSLQIIDVSKRTWCNEYRKEQIFSLQTVIKSKNEPQKNQHNTPGDISVISERDISTELLLQLQNSSIQDNKHRQEWKEFQESRELLLKSNTDLVEESVIKDAESARGACQPHTHVFFLKTHKSASSTVMNILFRFGEYHNLTFAFPINNYPQFLYPFYFSAHFVEGYTPRKSGMFDVMCHHMRFLLTEVEKVMPSDTFYFTILRNPVSLMESSFSYYKSLRSFYKAKNLEDFLNNTSTFYVATDKLSGYSKNLMAFDLGFDHNGKETVKHFQLTSRMVEATFNLVMITEYFDESLILLKDALCWSLDDVLSFPLNSRSKSNKIPLSLETKEKIKKWNQYDWQLYVYFNNSFWKRVEKFGRQRMQSEVQELQKKRAQLAETCLQDGTSVDPDKVSDMAIKPFQSGIHKILGYNLNPGLREQEQLLCQKMVTPELQYTKVLTQRRLKKSRANAKRSSKVAGAKVLIRGRRVNQITNYPISKG
ncbi:galactose-3-O-sulfotransferase 2-like [Discoglossus pictus]